MQANMDSGLLKPPLLHPSQVNHVKNYKLLALPEETTRDLEQDIDL